MLRTFKSFFKKVPEEYNSVISVEIVKNNLRHAKIMAALIVILELMVLGISFIPTVKIQYAHLWRYRWMYLLVVSYAALFLIMANRLERHLKRNTKVVGNVVIFSIWGTVLWSALISVYDQVLGLDGFAYLFILVAIAVVFILTPMQSVLVYGSSLVFYFSMTYMMAPNKEIVFKNVINTSVLIIVSWVISIVLRKGYIDNSLKGQVIKKQKAELEKIVLLDPMTGLYNRRGLEEKLEEYYSKAKIKNDFITGFMFDIDYFKGINDTYGHDKGDDAIRFIAGQIIKIAEKYNGIGSRYGGDEFCMILPNVSDIAAQLICKEVKTMVSLYEIDSSEAKVNRLSVSSGCCTTTPNNISAPWHLITQADQALYRIKRAR